MDFMTAMDIASSGLSAERTMINIISMNMANVKTTRTAQGAPYVRKSVVMESSPVYSPFDQAMWDAKNRMLKGVKISHVAQDSRPFKEVYEPGHPDANKDGYVRYPDINIVEEMANLISALRTYESGVSSIESVKKMYNKALTIGQG
jgi:flagellar basal-body rod protein FlgC